MPFSATPPEGLVTLTANARTVLEKRYLVKDASGKAVEKPGPTIQRSEAAWTLVEPANPPE